MKRICDMSRRDRVRWKVRLLWLLVAAMLVYMVVIGETGGGDSRIQTRLAEIFGRVVFFGGLGVVIWRLMYNKRLLKDKLLMKQDAAKTRDERERYLHDKSGGVVVDALLVCLTLVTLTASFYDMTVFYTALGALALTGALKVAVWLAYSRLGNG